MTVKSARSLHSTIVSWHESRRVRPRRLPRLRAAAGAGGRLDLRLRDEGPRREAGPKREDRLFFFFQAEDGIRDLIVTGVQTCALPILLALSVRNWMPARSAA